MSTLDARLDTRRLKEPIAKEPTAQDIFDTVVGHLFKQGKRSTRWGWCCGLSGEQEYTETCAYRSDEGLKCAIGILIPDESYNNKLEGVRIAVIIDDHALPTYFKNHVALLDDLQLAHDNLQNWVSKGSMIDVFGDVAANHELKFDRGQYNV